MRETKDENGKCHSCGFDSSKYAPEPFQLPPMTPLNGRYLIGKAIGIGGFGITYIALDTQLQIPVAVKELYIKKICRRGEGNKVIVSQNNKNLFEENKTHFLSEARVLAMFSKDDGIVAVKEHFEENDTAYIVMEYLDGMTLKNHIKGKKLPYKEATSLLRPISRALTKVHQFNVVHKDVSPENIMVTSDNTVKLLDFGGAINIVSDESAKTVSFKRGYAPPEQYVRNGKIGAWTDVYALASTIYYCITGEKPADSMERKAGKTIPKPSECGAKLPSKAEAALMKAMEIEPDKRYQTVDEFWNEWDQISFSSTRPVSRKILYAGMGATALFIAAIIILLNGGKSYNVGDVYDPGEGVYMLVNAENNSFCLGVNQNFSDDYSDVCIFTSEEEGGVQAINSNRFYVSEQEDDYRTLQVCHTNSFIEASEEGLVFQNRELSEGESSKWQLIYAGHDEETDEDIVMIRNADGRVITPTDNSLANGNTVNLCDEDGSYIQRWNVRWSPIDEDVEPMTVHQEGDFVEEISGTKNLISGYGDAGEVLLSVSGDTSLDSPEMIIWENVWDETQKFEFSFTGNESRYRIYPIKQPDGGHRCLEYDPDSKKIVMKDESDNPNQLFRVVYAKFGTYLIQAYDESVLGYDMNDDGSVNGRPVVARPYDSVSDSRFEKWLIKDPQE